MNRVDPIRNRETVREIKRQAEMMGQAPYMMMLLGLNTGLRISDLLEVRVADIQERGYIVRREIKTGKQTEIRFHPSVVAELQRLTAGQDGRKLLFPSRDARRRGRPMTRQTAYKWVREACRRAGYRGPVGCHTLRKTYGYHHYQEFHDIVTLMLHFNHSSEAITLRYIGITQDMINQKTTKFRL